LGGKKKSRLGDWLHSTLREVCEGWGGPVFVVAGEESKDRSRSPSGMTTRKATATTKAKAKAKAKCGGSSLRSE
jgi:hypothetical protein